MLRRSPESIYEEESPERARALLLPMAESADADAQFFLGHLADEESPPKPVVALDWYRKAAAGGFLEAQHWVASFLYHGMGTARDVPAALELFRESAAAGDAASQWKLGEHLVQHRQSLSEGLGWLRQSAAQGHIAAAELLAKQSGRET